MADTGDSRHRASGENGTASSSPPAGVRQLRGPAYWCVPCERGFASRYDLRKHGEEVHGMTFKETAR